MPMPIHKARQVIAEYKKADFNASLGLINAGYKKSTATKQSKAVINSALRKVASADTLEVVNSSKSPRNKLLELVKITEDELLNEYMKIVLQDKDLTNKLKAMLPLLKTQGIVWEESQTTVNPTLNLTVKSNTPVSDHAQNISEPSTDNVIDVVSSVSNESVDHVLESESNSEQSLDSVEDSVSQEVEQVVEQVVETAQQSQ